MYALSQFVPLLDVWCRTSIRGKIREQKGIEGTCIKDFLLHWFCGLCALVQEARVSDVLEVRWRAYYYCMSFVCLVCVCVCVCVLFRGFNYLGIESSRWRKHVS